MASVVPVAHAVVQLVAHIERFCAQPVRVRGSELAADMAELGRVRDLIQLKFSEMAAAFATTDEYEAQGAVSPIQWIRLNCHMGGGAAADSIAIGEQIANLPGATEAMAEGAIGFAHVALMARTATAIAEAEGPAKPFDETRLLEKARDFSVGKFRNFCHHARHAADPDGYATEEAQGVEARSLSMITGEGGLVWLRGVLDPEGGAVLRTALEPLARRTGKVTTASEIADLVTRWSSSGITLWTAALCRSARANARTCK